MLLREAQQDLPLRHVEEAFVQPGGQSEVDQRIPGEAIADDRPPQKAPGHGHLPEVSEEIVERDRPGVQVKQDRVAPQIDVHIVMASQPDGLREPRQAQDADHRQGHNPGRSHPRDARPDPSPEQAIDHIQRDRRLASPIGADNRIDGSRSRPARPLEKRPLIRAGFGLPVIAGRHGMRVDGHRSRTSRPYASGPSGARDRTAVRRP